MQVAILALKSMGPKQIITAAPVYSAATCIELEAECGRLVRSAFRT